MLVLLYLQRYSPLPGLFFPVISTKISSYWTTTVWEGLTIPYTALRIASLYVRQQVSEPVRGSHLLIDFLWLLLATHVFVPVLQEEDAKIKFRCTRDMRWETTMKEKKGLGRLGQLSEHNEALTSVKEREGSLGRKILELQCSFKKVFARLANSRVWGTRLTCLRVP